jgi:hypothetical protein
MWVKARLDSGTAAGGLGEGTDHEHDVPYRHHFRQEKSDPMALEKSRKRAMMPS